MTPKELFDDYLVLGKKITLEFPSTSERDKFVSHLRVIKRRAEEYSARFGFTSGTETQAIRIESFLVSDDPTGAVVVKVSLGEKKSAPTAYKILSIDETSEQEEQEQEPADEILPADLGKDKD